MKIGRRGLFGLGAAAAVAAPVAVVAATKPASVYAASPLDLIKGDLAEMTRWHRAELLAAQRAANPAWIVREDGTASYVEAPRGLQYRNAFIAAWGKEKE